MEAVKKALIQFGTKKAFTDFKKSLAKSDVAFFADGHSLTISSKPDKKGKVDEAYYYKLGTLLCERYKGD